MGPYRNDDDTNKGLWALVGLANVETHSGENRTPVAFKRITQAECGSADYNICSCAVVVVGVGFFLQHRFAS